MQATNQVYQTTSEIILKYVHSAWSCQAYISTLGRATGIDHVVSLSLNPLYTILIAFSIMLLLLCWVTYETAHKIRSQLNLDAREGYRFEIEMNCSIEKRHKCNAPRSVWTYLDVIRNAFKLTVLRGRPPRLIRIRAILFYNTNYKVNYGYSTVVLFQ